MVQRYFPPLVFPGVCSTASCRVSTKNIAPTIQLTGNDPLSLSVEVRGSLERLGTVVLDLKRPTRLTFHSGCGRSFKLTHFLLYCKTDKLRVEIVEISVEIICIAFRLLFSSPVNVTNYIKKNICPFVPSKYFQSSLIFASMAGAWPSEAPEVAPLQGRLLTFPSNIILGQKCLHKDKQSSLLRKFFYNIGPKLKNLLGTKTQAYFASIIRNKNLPIVTFSRECTSC